MQTLISILKLTLCLIPILLLGCGGGSSGGDSEKSPSNQNGEEVSSLEAPRIEEAKHFKKTGVRVKWGQVDDARYYTVERRGGLKGKQSKKVLNNLYIDEIPPQFRSEVTYRVRACSSDRCSDFSSPHKITGEIGNSAIAIKSNFPVRDARFGSSMALSDDNKWLAISAPLESTDQEFTPTNAIGGAGDKSGTVYIYENIKEGWALRQRIKSGEYAAAGRFGYDIEFSGNSENLIIGQPQRDVAWSSSNRSYALIYEVSNERFVHTASLKIPESHSNKSKDQYADFGKSVTISKNGSIVAVGAPSDTTSETGVNPNVSEVALPQPKVGAVFIFKKTEKGKDYTFSDLLKPFYLENNDPGSLEFGGSLGMSDSGDQVFVGILGDPSLDGGINADPTDKYTDADDPVDMIGVSYRRGAVQEFIRDDQVWKYGVYLKPDEHFTNLEFGEDLSVSKSGNFVAVSSVNSYLFKQEDDLWEKVMRLEQAGKMSLSPEGSFLASGNNFRSSNGDDTQCSVTSDSNGGFDFFVATERKFDQIFQFDILNQVPNFEGNCGSLSGANIEISKEGRILVGVPREDSVEGGVGAPLTSPDLQDSGAVFLF